MDDTIKEALLIVKKEVKEKFGEDYSIEELYNITSSQFKIANLAFKKGLEVRLPIWGSFINNRKFEAIEDFKTFEEAYKDAPKEIYEKEKQKLKIKLSEKKKELNKERNKKKNNETLEDIINTPDIVYVPNIYDKDLQKVKEDLNEEHR